MAIKIFFALHANIFGRMIKYFYLVLSHNLRYLHMLTQTNISGDAAHHRQVVTEPGGNRLSSAWWRPNTVAESKAFFRKFLI